MKKRLKKKKKLQQEIKELELEIKELEQNKQLFALACKMQADILAKRTKEKQKLIYEIANLDDLKEEKQKWNIGIGRRRKKII